MPVGTIPINVSNDFHYADNTVNDLIADSGLGLLFTAIDLTIVVTDLTGNSLNYGLYATVNEGGAYSGSNCTQFVSFGSAFQWHCDLSGIQPSSVQIWIYPRGAGAFPRTLRCNATGTFSYTVGGNCNYGTRPKSGATFTYFLSPGLIDTWLATTKLALLAPVFTALWFTFIDLTGICGTGPGQMPVLDNSINMWSTAQKLAFLKQLAWFSLCECIPGSPPPVPFQPPPQPPPTTIPTVPVFPCSDVDPCAALVQLQQSVAAIARTLANTDQLVTLQQRYSLPFAYILGATHPNLAGTNSFALPSGLIGLLITIDSTPVGTLTLPGTPPYNENLGWVSILDANGFIAEKRVTRTPHVWMPPLMQDAIKFGFNLNPGVNIHVTELQAEP